MTTVSASTEQKVTWSEKTDQPSRLMHMTLPDVIESVMRGVEQAAKGEGVEIDPDDLPTDDDD